MLCESSSLCDFLSWPALNPAIQLAQNPSRSNTLASLTVRPFNQLGQYANSPGNRDYCYSELTVSSLVMAVTIASTH